MKLLTATRERQGERPGDFCHAIEGELVLLGAVCADDERNPEGSCGCGRAFAGMSSHRATTTALVRDLDLTYDDLRSAVEAHHVAAGLGAHGLGGGDLAGPGGGTVGGAADLAPLLPVGTGVGPPPGHVTP